MKQKRHGSSCSFCWNRLQYYCRRYGLKHTSIDLLTDLQRGYLVSDSKRLREQVLAEVAAKAARKAARRSRENAAASETSSQSSAPKKRKRDRAKTSEPKQTAKPDSQATSEQVQQKKKKTKWRHEIDNLVRRPCRRRVQQHGARRPCLQRCLHVSQAANGVLSGVVGHPASLQAKCPIASSFSVVLSMEIESGGLEAPLALLLHLPRELITAKVRPTVGPYTEFRVLLCEWKAAKQVSQRGNCMTGIMVEDLADPPKSAEIRKLDAGPTSLSIEYTYCIQFQQGRRGVELYNLVFSDRVRGERILPLDFVTVKTDAKWRLSYRQTQPEKDPLNVAILARRRAKQLSCASPESAHRRGSYMKALLRREREAAKRKAKVLRTRAALAVNLAERSDSSSSSSSNSSAE